MLVVKTLGDSKDNHVGILCIIIANKNEMLGAQVFHQHRNQNLFQYNNIVNRRQLAILFEMLFRIVAKRKSKDSSNGLRAIHIVNQRISLPL